MISNVIKLIFIIIVNRYLLIICTSISLLLKPRAESSKNAGLPAGTNLMESPVTDIFGTGIMPTRQGDPIN